MNYERMIEEATEKANDPKGPGFGVSRCAKTGLRVEVFTRRNGISGRRHLLKRWRRDDWSVVSAKVAKAELKETAPKQ
jgi:hypothetical protein